MNQEKAEILILGSFHMSEIEGLDTHQRQMEIEELVSKIGNFKPTKIAVEMEPKESKTCNELYKRYQSGSFSLPINEIYQVGFRLGVELKHNEIYPTDWMGTEDMSFGEVQSWAEEHQSEMLKEILAGVEDIPVWTEDKTVLGYYRELNEPAFLDLLHKVHLNIARIGEVDHYVGINWLSWWYKRNLIMFSNLSRLIESKEERILFIVGIGHSSIVTKFIEESELCEVVKPLHYLS
ncbi:DUF5694 domain-containing protein [Sporosarcina jeotgali]|uniref:DUF5694 domain-containing protein n=1 Tax=Sporosarcina jeotgali TaxID=3020056 RepID=A0ABZ0L1V7_9BACL|nr:DUF5694 domain-containing protein [Sporosarcina sp. B2O-1]WOV85617.1 DUF5694 domain-containing protein [Sporosarcina sp. B2O-1]